MSCRKGLGGLDIGKGGSPNVSHLPWLSLLEDTQTSQLLPPLPPTA